LPHRHYCVFRVQLHSSNIAKLVAQAWKNLAADERSAWEELAREDKFRYEIEKTLYKGPWRIEKTQKTKDVNTPKRPVSAYLAFANSRRADVRRQMQKKVSNTELSRELAKMWKESPDEVRHSYIAEAKQKRQKYLAAMIELKKKVKNENAHDNEEAALRQQEEEFSLNAEAIDDCIIDMFIEPVHINEEAWVSNMAANSNTLRPDSKMNAVLPVNSQPYSYQPDTRNFFKAADQSQPSDRLFGKCMTNARASNCAFVSLQFNVIIRVKTIAYQDLQCFHHRRNTTRQTPHFDRSQHHAQCCPTIHSYLLQTTGTCYIPQTRSPQVMICIV
jgi:hypothetical protein